MAQYTTQDICNIAFVGQAGSGKTSLVEALLYQAGASTHIGKIETGNTVCDFDSLEKTHQHSLNASLVSFDYQQRHINIIDTPGSPDFLGQSLSVFPAVETVAVVINAQSGVEMVTRRMLAKAAKRRLCQMIVINKIDIRENDLAQLVNDVQEIFGKNCLPINLPAQQGQSVADCFFSPDGEADFSSVSTAHTQIIDQVVEVDEELMALYLEQGEDLSPEQLHQPFERALREGHLIPICFVSARTGAGVDELLNVMSCLMPNPLEGNPRPFLKGQEDEETAFYATADEDKHVIAHVFKITADPFMGKLGVFRIHQGTITKDSQLFIGDGRKPFKVNHLLQLQGKQQHEIEKGIPGDLCAVAKVDAIHFDAVLHDSHDEDYLHLKPLDFPEPMFSLAISAKKQGDEQKISNALHKITAEDPCLKVIHHATLNETVLQGLGELHVRIALEKIQQYYGVEVETNPPKIPYRETISHAAEGYYRHKKQTGGAGQFGEVSLRIKPRERGEGCHLHQSITGGAIPAQFIPAVYKGIQQAIDSGVAAGYPMQDIDVEVYDGKYHSVDSKEIAFVSAGKKAFLAAVRKAKPILLEPFVLAEITSPDENMGNITGALASKRARIQGSDSYAHRVVIKAEVPLSEMMNYTTELRSATGGQGFFNMELSHYEPLPTHLQQQIMANYLPEEELET